MVPVTSRAHAGSRIINAARPPPFQARWAMDACSRTFRGAAGAGQGGAGRHVPPQFRHCSFCHRLFRRTPDGEQFLLTEIVAAAPVWTRRDLLAAPGHFDRCRPMPE